MGPLQLGCGPVFLLAISSVQTYIRFVMETPKTLLVVEDESDIREIFKLILEADGYRVETAANGQEALNCLKILPPPNLILLDLMMPVMNGWEFLQMRESMPQLKEIPIVVISAFLDKLQPGGVLDGAAGFLRKPFDINAVLEMIKKCCTQAQL